MGNMKLHITGPSGESDIALEPRGMVIGRTEKCDIVLRDKGVSRHHARIFQDPFKRWVIEDLDSHNGVVVEGHRIKVQVVHPGDRIEIARFVLKLEETPAGKMKLGSTVAFESNETLSRGEDKARGLSPILIQHLNRFSADLSGVPHPDQLYSVACDCLADILNALVVVVRLPAGGAALPDSPAILACHFGSGLRDSADASLVRMSRRVLDAVREADVPVKATSNPGADEGEALGLTVVDRRKPHAVFAVRVNSAAEAMDVLYVDMLEKGAPETMLDFVELAARQVNAAQKHLYLAELEKKEEALRKANAELLEKDRIKDEYVSRITHDIKGHLAAIVSCLSVASSELPCELAGSVLQNFMDRAANRTGRLTEFVNELLNLTRMRLGGELEMNTFLLSESLKRVLEDIAGKAGEKSIAINHDLQCAGMEIIGNELSIREVLANLVSNAVKYTPEGRHVDIRVGLADDGEAVQVDVVDAGIGIPEKDLGRVFDEFFRAGNARQGKIEGTGLGLSIVKQIVVLHGGRISAASREGEGSTFTVVLPLDARPHVDGAVQSGPCEEPPHSQGG